MALALRRVVPLLLGAGCLVFIAACGDDNDDSGSSSSEAAPPATTETAPSGGGTSTAGGGGGGGAEKIDVAAAEPGSPTPFAFDPKKLDAKAGKVTFTLDNPSSNQAPHALEIEGNGVEEETETIMPGNKATLDVDLKPGTYEFYCPVDGHKDQGMEGTLTVQ
jgi:plastocyanin